MWIPKELGWMATRLKGGHRVNRITVRYLLRMFKAERRGLNKVQDIRAALESLGLQTEPDFESEWIDARIRICLKNGTIQGNTIENGNLPDEDHQLAQEEELEEEIEPGQIESCNETPPPIVISSAGDGIVETKLSEPPDPTFRIGSLPAANKPLITVGQDDLRYENAAIRLFTTSDYARRARSQRHNFLEIDWCSICHWWEMQQGARLPRGCSGR
jgi:hypothetical protein